MREPDKRYIPILDVVRRSDNSGSPLVLFLSGISGNRAQWELVHSRIPGDMADIGFAAPILPNVAFNGARPTVTGLVHLIAKEVDSAGYDRVVLVAHSVGSFVALGMCRILEGRVKSAILVNGGLATVARFLDRPVKEFRQHPRTCLTALKLFALVGSPAPERLKRSVMESERSSKALFGNLVSSETLESAEHRRSLMTDAGSSAIPRTLWVNRHHWREFSSYAGEISNDVVFLVGDQDPMTSEADTEDMASLLPHSTVLVLPGIGHAAPVETAGAVAELVLEKLNAGG